MYLLHEKNVPSFLLYTKKHGRMYFFYLSTPESLEYRPHFRLHIYVKFQTLGENTSLYMHIKIDKYIKHYLYTIGQRLPVESYLYVVLFHLCIKFIFIIYTNVLLVPPHRLPVLYFYFISYFFFSLIMQIYC